jgi:CRISPR-associated protein Cas6
MIDILFSVQGTSIPIDHGFKLFSAVSRIFPHIHRSPTMGIHPISGQFENNGRIHLNKDSFLAIRSSEDDIVKLSRLTGHTLNIDSDELIIGSFRVKRFVPSNNLFSRLVVIKGKTDPEEFLAYIKRLLLSQDIHGVVSILRRGKFEIHGRRVIGFGLGIERLSVSNSLKLQTLGLGGRRHFGCGIFVPPRNKRLW